MDASALASALDNLEKVWSSFDWWLNFWTVLVVIGVAVELAVLIAEYAHEWRDFKRGTIHSPEKPSLVIFGLGFLGAGMVAIGVAGEFRIHVKAGKVESEMRSKATELVVIANKEAKEAGERTAQLTKENLVLQADVLKLRQAAAPRRLTESQKAELIKKLSATTAFTVKFAPPANGSREVFDFMDDLVDVFVRMKLMPPGVPSDTGPVSIAASRVRGIAVAVKGLNECPAANIFLLLMRKWGFEVSVMLVPGMADDREMRILVSSK
jgi:hypothetical protein